MVKKELRMDIYIERALVTWHGGEDESGKINMALSMAGELGEILNLYRKKWFKPSFSPDKSVFLDELGDFWYYIRIFAHLSDNKVEPIVKHWEKEYSFWRNNQVEVLAELHQHVNRVVEWGCLNWPLDEERMVNNLILYLMILLKTWKCSIDELTEMNYQKLTKNKDHHGWKKLTGSPYVDAIQAMSEADYKKNYLGNWEKQDRESEV